MALALLFFTFFLVKKWCNIFGPITKGAILFYYFLGFILTYKQLLHSLRRNYPSSLMTSPRLVFLRFTCHVFYLGWTNLLITGGMCQATPPLSPLLFFEWRGRLYRGYPIYGRMRYVEKSLNEVK